MSSIEELAKKMEDAQEFGAKINKHIDSSLTIDGKTLIQWKRESYVKIPKEFNPSTLIDAAAAVMEKYQIAARYRDTYRVPIAITEQAKSDKYHEQYQAARNQHEEKYGKPLAAESCKTSATLAIAHYEGAIATQKVVHDFFTGICNTLVEVRKILELIAKAVSADAYMQRDIIIKGDRGNS